MFKIGDIVKIKTPFCSEINERVVAILHYTNIDNVTEKVFVLSIPSPNFKSSGARLRKNCFELYEE